MKDLPGKSIKVSSLFIGFLFVLLVVSGFTILRWAYESSEVLKINNAPVPVAPPAVTPDDKVYLKIDFCKKRDLTDRTTLHLVGNSGARIPINWPTGRAPAQCTVFEQVPLSIPAQTPTGKYHAEFTVCYDINPLKKNRCTTFISQDFSVINRQLNPGAVQVQP